MAFFVGIQQIQKKKTASFHSVIFLWLLKKFDKYYKRCNLTVLLQLIITAFIGEGPRSSICPFLFSVLDVIF